MPIIQMLMLGSKGDSAFLPSPPLPNPFEGSTWPQAVSFGFNLLLGGSQYFSIDPDPIPSGPYMWHTGPFSENSYEARFTITSHSGVESLTGSSTSTWITLGGSTTNSPAWTLSVVATTSTCIGTLEIRNSTSGVVLASTTVNMSTNNTF